MLRIIVCCASGPRCRAGKGSRARPNSNSGGLHDKLSRADKYTGTHKFLNASIHVPRAGGFPVGMDEAPKDVESWPRSGNTALVNNVCIMLEAGSSEYMPCVFTHFA